MEVIKHYEKLLKNGQFPVACNGIEYRWWSHKDYGQSNAINSGLAVARGDVLAWLNSDDYYEDGALKKVATFFDLHPGFDLLYGSGFMVDEPGLKKSPAHNHSTNFNELRMGGGSIFQPSAFFSKNIIKVVGGLDEDLHFVMDLDLWLKIFKNSKKVFFSSHQLSNFRRWSGSKSGSSEEKFKNENRVLWKNMGDQSLI